MSTRYVDRSRVLAFQSCPRKRFLGFEIYGRGIQPIKMAIPLVVGQCVHRGLEVLLKWTEKLKDEAIELAVDEALEEYNTEVRARGFVLDPEEESHFVFQEQKALIEAMIRVWALRRLPGFLEQFEVLEVEREDTFTLYNPDEHFNLTPPDPIVWMSRADGLLRERASGDLYVLSFKTSADWNDFKDKEARIDMQGMSELYAIERRLFKERWSENFDKDDFDIQGIKLAGVQMEFLLKGRRSRDKETKQYLQDSILVRPYFKDGGGLIEDEYAWKYWTHCDGPHTTSGGKKCNGDANHSLGKGWYRVPIWEHMPIKEWIQLLHEGSVQSDAGDALEGLVVSPMPFFRHQEEIESWRLQVESQEARIAEIRKGAATDWPDDMKFYLDRNFPQHREACYKYGEKHPCQFLSICFENIGDPLESGLFQLRVPHHSPETAQFDKVKNEWVAVRLKESELYIKDQPPYEEKSSDN